MTSIRVCALSNQLHNENVKIVDFLYVKHVFPSNPGKHPIIYSPHNVPAASPL